MSEFEKTCTYCKAKIKLSDKQGKWLPFNLDGSSHDCRKQEPKDHTVKIDEIIKKLTAISIDLEALKH